MPRRFEAIARSEYPTASAGLPSSVRCCCTYFTSGAQSERVDKDSDVLAFTFGVSALRLHNGTYKAPSKVIIERVGFENGRDGVKHSVNIVGRPRRAFCRRPRLGVSPCCNIDDAIHRHLQGRKKLQLSTKEIGLRLQ